MGYFGQEELPCVLDEKQVRELAERMQQGCEESREKLAVHNLRLVVRKALQYRNTGMEVEELIELGVIGLMQSLRTYDVKKGVKLSTYACVHIEHVILAAWRNRNAKKRQGVVVSLDAIVDEDAKKKSTFDVFLRGSDDVEAEIEKEADRQLAWNALNVLNERERKVIAMLYGVFGEKQTTQMEAAKALGVSQPHISRIEKRAMGKLRSMFHTLRREEIGA